MKILMLTSRLPYPPNRGDRLRVFHFARILSQRHQLTLVSFYSQKSELEHLHELMGFFSQIHPIYMPQLRSVLGALTSILKDVPLQVGYYHLNQMTKFLSQHLKTYHYDLVYTHLIRMAPYSRYLADIPKILYMTDLISTEIARSLEYRKGFSRWLYQLELPRLRNYETQVAGDYDACWLISKAEADKFSLTNPSVQARVFSNGVDAKNYFPSPNIERQRRLIFVGHLGVYHNIDAVTYFCKEIWPVISAEYPEYQVDIVGADPAPQIFRLAALPGVNVHGFVPDLNHMLNQASIFVAPLRFAAGVQNKVLEAMATATPVITTSLVNEGMEGQPGRELIIADNSDDIIQALRLLINQPNLAQQIGFQGYHFVRNKYSWENVHQAIAKWQPHP